MEKKKSSFLGSMGFRRSSRASKSEAEATLDPSEFAGYNHGSRESGDWTEVRSNKKNQATPPKTAPVATATDARAKADAQASIPPTPANAGGTGVGVGINNGVARDSENGRGDKRPSVGNANGRNGKNKATPPPNGRSSIASVLATKNKFAMLLDSDSDDESQSSEEVSVTGDELMNALDDQLDDEMDKIVMQHRLSVALGSNPLLGGGESNEFDDQDEEVYDYDENDEGGNGAGSSSAPASPPRPSTGSTTTGSSTTSPAPAARRGSHSTLVDPCAGEAVAEFGWGGVPVSVDRQTVAAAQQVEAHAEESRRQGNARSLSSAALQAGADVVIPDGFTCPECSKTFPGPEELKEHFDAGHGRIQNVRSTSMASGSSGGSGDGGGGDKGFLDSVVGSVGDALGLTESPPSTSDGTTEMVLNAFVCPECMEQFPSSSSLKAHFDSSHSNDVAAPLPPLPPSPSSTPSTSASSVAERRRGSLLSAAKGMLKSARSAQAEATIVSAGAAATARAAAGEGSDLGGVDVSESDLVHSFASLLLSLRDPHYLRAFVEERDGVRTLATMSNHIVGDARKRGERERRREARQVARRKRKQKKNKNNATAAGFMNVFGEDEEDEGEEDEEDDSDDDEDEDDVLSPSAAEAGEVHMLVSEITLQHCVLKALLTVLDSAPGLEWVLRHEQVLVGLFLSIQASGQPQHMGKLYAIITSLCFLDENHPGMRAVKAEEEGLRLGPSQAGEEGASEEGVHTGKRLFMACLDAVAEQHPHRARFDSVCRLLCDADSSWQVKLQAMQCLNTLVVIAGSEEERLDLRALVGRALTALAVEFELPLDVGEEPGVARARLEETFQGALKGVTSAAAPAAGCAPSRHRGELLGLWRQLSELRGGDRGELALEACLAQSSTLPVLLHLRFLALRCAGQSTTAITAAVVGEGGGGEGGGYGEGQAQAQAAASSSQAGGGDRVEGFAGDALLFVEKLDLYEKTCLQDRIEVDLSLEKLAPQQDSMLAQEEDELGRAMVLDAKERVVARLTVMMQQLQREAVTMGPLVDSFATALLDMVITAVNEELDTSPPPSSTAVPLEETLSGLLDGIVEDGEDEGEGGGGATRKHATAVATQAMSLSDSPALMETVQRIRSLEQEAQRFEKHLLLGQGMGNGSGPGVGQSILSSQYNHNGGGSGDGGAGGGGDDDVDIDNLAVQIRPSLYQDDDLDDADDGEGGGSGEGSGGGGGGENKEGLAAVEEEYRLKVAALEEKVAVYHTLAPVSEDEMTWLIESKSQNAYLVAERREAEAQAAYSATIVEADVHGLVSRLLKNHPARRVLDSLAKADCSSLFDAPHPDSEQDKPPTPLGGVGGGGGGGRPDMASMLGGALAKKNAAAEGGGGGRPDMASMLGGALAKKNAAAAAEGGGGGRPDMASMLGGALAKKNAASEGGGGGRPDMASMLGGALAKKNAAASEVGGGGRPDMASMLGGALAKKKPATPGGGGMGGVLSGIGGGLGGLKKSSGGGRNSAAGLLKQLKKEHSKAEQDLKALRSRSNGGGGDGSSTSSAAQPKKKDEAAVLVEALLKVLEAHAAAETRHHATLLAIKAKEPFDLAEAEEHEARKAAKAATLAHVERATAATKAAQKAYQLKEAEEEDATSPTGRDGGDGRAAARAEGKLTEAEAAEVEAKELRGKSLEAKATAEKLQAVHVQKQSALKALGIPPPALPTAPPSHSSSSSSSSSSTSDPAAVSLGVAAVAEAVARELASAEAHAVKSAAECQKKMDDLQTSLEKWAKRKLEAPERDAQEAEREKAWAASNAEANDKALRLMRQFMPPSLPTLTTEAFEDAIASRGGRYSPQLLDRLKAKKLLLWVVTHPSNIATANFLAGAHKISFVNLQEYDVVELRAVYAVLPPYFELDATPGQEHLKKKWREGLVKCLKDLILRQSLWEEKKAATGLLPHEQRNGAYFFPSANDVAAQRAKWGDAAKRIEDEELKLPAMKVTLLSVREEYDRVTVESREPALREVLGKEALREWVKEAKSEVTKATRALGDAEGKIKRWREEEVKGQAARLKLDESFKWCEAQGKLGQPVPPVFEENPLLELAASAFKKLSDEEEIALRNAERAALLASKATSEGEAAKASASSASSPTSGLSSASVEKPRVQFEPPGGVEGTAKGGERPSISSSGKQRQSMTKRQSKKDFMNMLEKTLGGEGLVEGGGSGGGGGRLGGKKGSFFGGGARKSKSKKFVAMAADPLEQVPEAAAPAPAPKVVLKKGASSKLKALLNRAGKLADDLSSVVQLSSPTVTDLEKKQQEQGEAMVAAAKKAAKSLSSLAAARNSDAQDGGSGGGGEGGTGGADESAATTTLSGLMREVGDDDAMEKMREKAKVKFEAAAGGGGGGEALNSRVNRTKSHAALVHGSTHATAATAGGSSSNGLLLRTRTTSFARMNGGGGGSGGGSGGRDSLSAGLQFPGAPALWQPVSGDGGGGCGSLMHGRSMSRTASVASMQMRNGGGDVGLRGSCHGGGGGGGNRDRAASSARNVLLSGGAANGGGVQGLRGSIGGGGSLSSPRLSSVKGMGLRTASFAVVGSEGSGAVLGRPSSLRVRTHSTSANSSNSVRASFSGRSALDEMMRATEL